MGVIMYRNNRYAGGGSADPSLHFDWSHQTLPQTGDTNTIYCIPTGDTSDPWDFYAWNDTDEEFVKIDFNMTISIDSALSDTSTNPVQNRVVKGAIDAKADNTQTFTEASTRANIASGETIATIFGKIKKFFSDLKAVAFSGSYNDLSDKPTIPAAQIQSDWNQTTTTAKDYIKNKPTIPAAQVNSDWSASSGVAQILNKPTSMPASDVYAWAKAATKPSYTASEVGALASDGTAAKATADANGNTISSTYMKKGVDYVIAGKKSGTTLGTQATAEGGDVTASGPYSHAEGELTTATEEGAHVEGLYNNATGRGAHAEGISTNATNIAAHTEGDQTSVSSPGGHAEGGGTTTNGNYGHAEGYFTQAIGNSSHAQGYYTKTKARRSHAEGGYTIANAEYQHVEGKYNVEDTNGTYAHIIGGGTADDARKNIFTVDWNGDVNAGRSNGLTNDTKLPTGADVISYLNSNFEWKSKSVNLTNSALNTINSLTVSEIANAKEVIIQAKNKNCQEHFFRVEDVIIDRTTNFTGIDSTCYVQWIISCNFRNNSISLATYTKGSDQKYPIIDKVYYR